MSEIKCVKEFGTANEDSIADIIKQHIPENAVIYKMYTDKYECDKSSDISDIEHLLELRAFNKDSELKISRSSMCQQFCWRLIDDLDFKERLKCGEDDPFDNCFDMRTLDDTQYLDIDTNKNKDDTFNYTATGGGKYSLPISNAEKVKIRNYVDYDEEGIAFICDFRIVKLLKKGEVDDE